MTFKEKLRALLAARRLSQAKLADIVEISPAQMSKWVREVNTPDMIQILKISKALKVPVDYLADASDERSIQEVDLESEVVGLAKDVGLDVAKRRIVGAPDIKYPPARP